MPGQLESGSLPSCEGDVAGQSSTRAQRVDNFGTVVIEVAAVTTGGLDDDDN